MIRLFTGISVPQNIRNALNIMQGGIGGAHWDDIENYHITLSFIGDIDESTAEEVDSLLASISLPAFDITLNGIGTFAAGDKLTHLWVGLEPSKELMFLKHRIDALLQHNHIPFDNRKYTPHVCLARLKGANEEQVVQFIQDHNLFKSHSFKVENFNLYQSYRGKNGTHYQPEATYDLL